VNKTNTVYVCDSITLCQITLADAYDIFSTINSQREFLGKWLPFVAATKTVSDSIAFVQSVLNAPPEQTELVYTIQYNKAFAGIIGFKDTDRLNGKTEIGYWLSEPLQGKGIVTKSTKKLIEIAFEKEQMNRIQ
jgi:ribosomal-protein-serine acetyltransferase